MLQPQKQNHEKAMDKLRESILKLANSEPNVPLSTTQNSILQQRLTHFLSCLHTTPDHPPYAWMIEKALQELDEEGGSSEDSISKFIKKEYDSLPWAHTTLLKHHLQKMTEKGEILMIDGGRFLLPGDSESFPKRKRKRKYLKRKRRGNLEIKQKKPRKKEKRVQHDDVEVVKEQNEVTVNGNHGQENQIREEHWELNGHHNEPSTDKEDGLQNYVTGNKVLHKRVQRIRVVHKQKGKQQLDATEEIEHLEDLELQQPKFSLSRVEETADISNLYPQEILENEKPGDNLPRILCPEAPPGFEFMVVEEDATANKAHNSLSVGLDSPKEDRVVHQSSEDQAPRMDDLSDALKQSKESPKQQSLDTERLEEESVAEDLLKTKKQQKNRPTRTLTRAQRKGTVIPNAPIVLTFQCQQQEQQVQLAMESSSEPSIPRKMRRTQLKRIISSQPAASTEQENSPKTKQQVVQPCLSSKKIGAQQQEQHISDRDRRLALESSSEPNQLSIRRKRTKTQQIGIIKTQPPPSTDLFPLNHLEQENSPETKQQVDKPCGLSEKTGALPNEMIIPDIHENLDKGEAQQLTELSKMEGSHEIILATVEPSSEKKQPTPEKLNMDDKPDILLLQSPTGFEAVSIEKSSQTGRAQRQLKRWNRNPEVEEPLITSKVEPLPFASADQHLVQMEEPLSTSKVEPLPFCAAADQHLVQMEEPLALATREEAALNLTDPQHEVHLEQQTYKRRKRTPKGKEGGADPDTTILKDLVLSKKLKKKQNGRGLARRRKAQ